MNYAVYLVVIDDTNEAVDALAQVASTMELVDDEIPSEESAIHIMNGVLEASNL